MVMILDYFVGFLKGIHKEIPRNFGTGWPISLIQSKSKIHTNISTVKNPLAKKQLP